MILGLDLPHWGALALWLLAALYVFVSAPDHFRNCRSPAGALGAGAIFLVCGIFLWMGAIPIPDTPLRWLAVVAWGATLIGGLPAVWDDVRIGNNPIFNVVACVFVGAAGVFLWRHG